MEKYKIWGNMQWEVEGCEGDFEGLGVIGNGSLWGNGDYEGGGHWAIGD